METARFWPICPFEARNRQIWSEFLLLCCRPRKSRFQWKWPVSGPSALLRLEIVKFGPNFCYCAVDQEKAVFQWKRAVSRFQPICPFGTRNGEIYAQFLLLCCRPRKSRFSMETNRFWPICPFGARNGQICFEFLLLCCRPSKGRFSMETGRFWAICPLGARNGQICFEFLLLRCKPRKSRFSMETSR